MTFIRLAVLGTLGALTWGGCAAPADTAASPSPMAAESSTTAHDDHHHALPAVTAGWPVEVVATKVVEAWSHRDATPAEWWAALEPLLSPAGVQDYAYTDPQNIPVLTLTGRARLLEAASTPEAVAAVEVPTSVGPFTVHLTRQAADTGWLARGMDFPVAAEDRP